MNSSGHFFRVLVDNVWVNSSGNFCWVNSSGQCLEGFANLQIVGNHVVIIGISLQSVNITGCSYNMYNLSL